MSMNVSSGDTEVDEKPMSEINTTPLVDVMLVMLIIFLITIPGDHAVGEGGPAEGGQHSRRRRSRKTSTSRLMRRATSSGTRR